MEQAKQADLIDRAIELAVEAHEEQKRKGTDTAYIIHPFSVAVILAKAGCPDETIAAGILHDTVEDTPVEIHYIRREFGETVASIVESCSEPNKTLPWEDRKEHTVKSLKAASLDARLVTCADKLHNLRTIARDLDTVGNEVWARFRRGRDEQKRYYERLVEVLCDRQDTGQYQPLFEELRKEMKRVFGKEKEQ